jgi:hypothetical protein
MKSIKIESVYKTLNGPGYLESKRKLGKVCGITEGEAFEYLKQDSYRRHKARRKTSRKRRVMTPGLNYLWQADIVFLPRYTHENDIYSCLLTVIDVLSKGPYEFWAMSSNLTTMWRKVNYVRAHCPAKILDRYMVHKKSY